MNKLIILIGILALVLISGCSSYTDCIDDCAKVECNYDGFFRANINSDKHCNEEQTIRERCYNECKPK